MSAISLTLIYILFSEYREEEFQQQQNEKIKYTVGLVTEFKQMSEELALLLDAQDIHDFYDEKLLIYNGQKELIFSSLDSLPIFQTDKILNGLSPSQRWIETKEGDYDLIGVYVESRGKTYYGVSKALDAYGYSKMYFLRNVLIAIFAAISIIVTLVALYLSNKISKPITRLAENLKKYDLVSENSTLLKPDTSSFELQHLTERFNELLQRTNEAFAFQKNAINHISHELKTPVAVLVSELEKTESYSNIDNLRPVLDSLVIKAKSLGEIINVFLEISKIESGQQIQKSEVRIDELLFDIIEELKMVYPDFHFELNYFPSEFNESQLVIKMNRMLVKQAFQNLLVNCISYGSEKEAKIKIDCSFSNKLKIEIANTGKTVAPEEKEHLFQHSFRGKNSEGKIGFGLGLVLAKRIMDFHFAKIKYSNPEKDLNVFQVIFYLDKYL
ncbi:sensor histidine kinase [Aequorivita ciconiae]|uniref:sensor histidine kinase n=1 Tax=Aequorivita ciconiae TaxID=2494375 RepID=UPI0013E2AEAC|nr:HAMP domain-containing sensor histidine kinase [Aequorivita sp. H23M31]